MFFKSIGSFCCGGTWKKEDLGLENLDEIGSPTYFKIGFKTQSRLLYS